MSVRILVATWAVLVSSFALAEDPPGRFVFDFDAHTRYHFGGVVGDRITANNVGWLTRAPSANPGLLAMFQLRDRDPRPALVPWAGEFVGKYLISAIQAIRMDNDPKLYATVKAVIHEVIAGQARDGYLGPFPKEERLLKHWDLWGHYHIMLALLMWHEQAEDPGSLAACRKAADLICRVYLDTNRRPRAAGSSEMNLAVIHALGQLYRRTREPRYLHMMRVIEKDWEQEGDYFRTGLAGVEFYRTPKPRWESLHNLQGLVELYLITNDDRYRKAFLNLWNSIRRLDRRNSGGFSSGEQATGTPFEPTAIETCCTIAWMALTVDALRLTGNPIAADELELSTYNGMLGAQHGSGSWWTYNTPMNGVREASHDSIVFQSRAGTPELNCCSVNAPRGLGMLSEWAIMQSSDGLVINYYGPMQTRLVLTDDLSVSIVQETQYPLNGKIRIQVRPSKPREFTVRLRIPSWSKTTIGKVTSRPVAGLSGAQPPPDAAKEVARTNLADIGTEFDSSSAVAGAYYAIRRTWRSGDVVELEFDMSLRYASGGGDMTGRMSVYRGPLLLAYDTLLNPTGEAEPSTLTPSDLGRAKIEKPARTSAARNIGQFAPWILVVIPKPEGPPLRLCDFASAGARGNHYVSWLPAREIAPPAPLPDFPGDGASVPAGRMLFKARRWDPSTAGCSVRLQVGTAPDLKDPLLDVPFEKSRTLVLGADQTRAFTPDVDHFWRLVAENPAGRAESPSPPRRFRIDASLPPLTDNMLTEYGENEDAVVVDAKLNGSPEPEYGTLTNGVSWKPSVGPGGRPNRAVELGGSNGMLVYKLKAFPARDYTVSLWFSPRRIDVALGQLFSAWSRGMDDPLRICVAKGKLYARIEAGTFYTTKGIPVVEDHWYHVCAVKKARTLTLYLNGKPGEAVPVPAEIRSTARDFALGGNPHYTGSSEQLACRVAGLLIFAKALTADEVAKLERRRD